MKIASPYKTPMHGFNLIEAAIVLGVVGLVIGGIWVAAASVNQTQKIQQVISGTGILTENIRALYKGQTPASGSTQLCDDLLTPLPAGYSLGSSFFCDAQDPFGHGLYVGIYNGGLPYTIGFVYYSVSNSACIKLVTSITRQANIYMSRNETAGTYFSLPTPLSEANSECSSDTQNISFSFKID